MCVCIYNYICYAHICRHIQYTIPCFIFRISQLPDCQVLGPLYQDAQRIADFDGRYYFLPISQSANLLHVPSKSNHKASLCRGEGGFFCNTCWRQPSSRTYTFRPKTEPRNFYMPTVTGAFLIWKSKYFAFSTPTGPFWRSPVASQAGACCACFWHRAFDVRNVLTCIGSENGFYLLWIVVSPSTWSSVGLSPQTATWTLGLRCQTPAFDARIGHPVSHGGQMRCARSAQPRRIIWGSL